MMTDVQLQSAGTPLGFLTSGRKNTKLLTSVTKSQPVTGTDRLAPFLISSPSSRASVINIDNYNKLGHQPVEINTLMVKDMFIGASCDVSCNNQQHFHHASTHLNVDRNIDTLAWLESSVTLLNSKTKTAHSDEGFEHIDRDTSKNLDEPLSNSKTDFVSHSYKHETMGIVIPKQNSCPRDLPFKHSGMGTCFGDKEIPLNVKHTYSSETPFAEDSFFTNVSPLNASSGKNLPRNRIPGDSMCSSDSGQESSGMPSCLSMVDGSMSTNIASSDDVSNHSNGTRRNSDLCLLNTCHSAGMKSHDVCCCPLLERRVCFKCSGTDNSLGREEHSKSTVTSRLSVVPLLFQLQLSAYKALFDDSAMQKKATSSQKRSLACLIHTVVLLTKRLQQQADVDHKLKEELTKLQLMLNQGLNIVEFTKRIMDYPSNVLESPKKMWQSPKGEVYCLHKQQRRLYFCVLVIGVLGFLNIASVRYQLFFRLQSFGVIHTAKKINRIRKIISENWKNIPSLLTEFWRIFIFRSHLQLEN